MNLTRPLVTISLVIAMAPAAHAQERGVPQVSCPPQGATHLVRSAEAVAYRPPGANRGVVHACSRRTRRSFDLSVYEIGDVGRPIEIAGPWIASVSSADCFCDAGLVVRLLNVRSGARRDGTPVLQYESVPPANPPHIYAIVLNRNGSGGWIQLLDGVREVHKFDANGADRLDSSAGQDLRALRIRGSRLSWRRAGTRLGYRLDRRARCGRRGSSTAIRTPEARAYYLGETTYACLYAENRHVVLGRIPSDFEYFGVNHLRLAGSYAGFDDGFAGRGGANADVRVVDLRDGRGVYEYRCCPFSTDDAHVVDLVLAPRGAIAWTQGRGPRSQRPVYELLRSDPQGDAVLLDTGVEPRSLRLDGITLTWRNSGELRSAELR